MGSLVASSVSRKHHLGYFIFSCYIRHWELEKRFDIYTYTERENISGGWNSFEKFWIFFSFRVCLIKKTNIKALFLKNSS